MVALNFLGRVS